MARIRSIKPEFWTHPVLGRQSAEVRLLALGLLSMSDDHGYFRADLANIRAAVDPFREDFASLREPLARLHELGWIDLSDHPEQGAVGKIAKWDIHQKVDHPSASKLKGYFDTGNVRESFAKPRESFAPDQGSRIKDQGVGGEASRGVANREVLPATATAAEAEKQNHTHAPSKAKNQSFTADDLGPMLVAHLAELGYSIQGPLKVAKAAVKCVSEAAAFWGVSLEQAFERLRDAQELYVASPAGKRAKPKPALWLYEDGSLMDGPATWDNPDCYTSQKAAQAETLIDDATGKPVAPEDRPYWQKFPNGRWHDVRREVSRYYTNARTRDCLEAKLHPGYKENLRPLTEAELKVCGRSVYEFSQWATWGEVRYPEPFPKRDCVKWAREKEKV